MIQITEKYFSRNKKQIAVLVDPDKAQRAGFETFISHASQSGVDLILVGGSLLHCPIAPIVQRIKALSPLPVLIFPGSHMQICNDADGILLLSLISGRNPEYLIGQHVQAAPFLAQSTLDILPTAYVLIESGVQTSVEYISNTRPIPRNKADIVVATALAGQQLGLQCIYLEAGSGAQHPIPPSIIRQVKQHCNIPIIVGGGLQTAEAVQHAFDAGADVVVLGTILEKNPSMLDELCQFTQ